LFFVTLLHSPKSNTKDKFFFTTETTLIYIPFSQDFGPLNLACLYRFCVTVEDLLLKHRSSTQKLYYYTSTNSHSRANSICLCCCYRCLYMGMTPEEAYLPFQSLHPAPLPFRDAAYGPSTYNLSILDVVRGVYKAYRLKILNFSSLFFGYFSTIYYYYSF
jgi:cell division cycle 14